MEMDEYAPGDIVPVTSSLYQVMHEPPASGAQFKTFYAGNDFPPCEDCGKSVRYRLPIRIIRKAIAS